MEVIRAIVEHFERPALALLVPVALVLLYLLERWRRRPVPLVVADLTLFETTPEIESEAKARRRRLGLRWLLKAAAATLLGLAAAGPWVEATREGPVQVDLVLDRGLSSATIEAGGRTRLDLSREHLYSVLDRLRPGDRARVHALPGAGTPRALSPSDARAALEALRPVAGIARLDESVPRVCAAFQGASPPVFLATDQEPPASAAASAVTGSPKPNRGIVGLSVGEDGALHVTLSSQGAEGDAALVLSARAKSGLVTVTRVAGLSPLGFSRLTWSRADGFPEAASEVSAHFEVADALPTDDRAFAVRGRAARRRVGLVGDFGPDVERALRAVPGARVEQLGAIPPEAQQLSYDLLVTSEVPEPLPGAALIVLPREVPKDASREGGRLGPGDRSLLPYTLAALAQEAGAVGAAIGPVGHLPVGLASLKTLVLAGEAPLLAASGSGRRLLIVATAPLTGTGWSRLRSFPLLWAEILDLAAPRRDGRIDSYTAGEPWPSALGLQGSPLHVKRYTDAEGFSIAGTSAPPLPRVPVLASRGFRPEDFSRLAAAREPAAQLPLSPYLALFGLFLLVGAWLKPASRGGGSAVARDSHAGASPASAR